LRILQSWLTFLLISYTKSPKMNYGKTFSGSFQSVIIPSQKSQPRYLTQSGQACQGSNLKEVKMRIKSVTSIRKITKTMNMIATARLKQAQVRMQRARTFYHSIGPLMEALPAQTDAKKHIIIPVGSDKGLCGAINTNLSKQVKTIIKEREPKGTVLELNCIGEKVPTQLAREHGNKIIFSIGESSKKPMTFLGASMIASRILEGEYDTASILYNKFHTVLSYTTTEKILGSPKSFLARRQIFNGFEFEDEAYSDHIPDLIQYWTACTLLHAYSDSNAAELGGRMSSMDNATRNAGEVIKKLTIMYNRRRQAAITTELTEIISGASAIQ